MVSAHVASRAGQWMVAKDLKHEFKGQYGLHSQSVQALAEKLEANVQYVTYKGRALGMGTAYIPEDYSTRTCSVCGHVRSSAPRGRIFVCPNPGCGAVVSRDGNGSANICSRARYGTYGKVQVTHLTYLRPLAVVAPRHGPTLLA
jgi:Putative transposase DNA-binding domain